MTQDPIEVKGEGEYVSKLLSDIEAQAKDVKIAMGILVGDLLPNLCSGENFTSVQNKKDSYSPYIKGVPIINTDPRNVRFLDQTTICQADMTFSPASAYNYYRSASCFYGGKSCRFDLNEFNPVYSILKSGKTDIASSYKEQDLTRGQDFKKRERYSCPFDWDYEGRYFIEDNLSIGFDGYVFSFAKVETSSGDREVRFKISKMSQELDKPSDILSSSRLESFNVSDYDELKSRIEELIFA